MAHVAIEAIRDQAVLVADFQRDRPVAPELPVREIEQQEAQRFQDRPGPAHPGTEGEVGKGREAGQKVERRHPRQTGRRQRQRQPVAKVAAVPHDLDPARAAPVRHADHGPRHQPDRPDPCGNRGRHGAVSGGRKGPTRSFSILVDRGMGPQQIMKKS